MWLGAEIKQVVATQNLMVKVEPKLSDWLLAIGF